MSHHRAPLHYRRAGVRLLALVAAPLVLASCLITPGDPGPADVDFTVNSSQGRHPISPLIYGSNSAHDIAGNGLTLIRSGGNRWTAYNWENNASNAGSDWCHQNDGYLSASSTPGEGVRSRVAEAHAAGAAALVTVPIVDHVAADKTGGSGPPACSGDVRNSGPGYLTTRFRANEASKGGPLSLVPDTADAAVYQDEFVNWLEQTATGQVLYSLDNEPDLWADTHAAIHPDPVSYTELADRTVAYASAVKAVAPDALVSGPVNYGFWGFETLQSAPDAANGHFLEWWLDQMAEAEAAAGHRLVDYLDLHWYPEARGGGVRITGPDTSAAVAEARVQAPRSLWDPTYAEDSWITNDYLHAPIRLLRATQERIDAHYPGTGLAVTEWNCGGGGHISGAVASADVLGVFGREGVAMASLWELDADESYTYAAFRAFRNYDGAGGAFEDTSIAATSSADAVASIYASVDSQDPTRMVLVAVNRSTSDQTAGIRISHTRRFAHADLYTITASGGADVVPAGTVDEVAANAFNLELPARSVTVIVPTA